MTCPQCASEEINVIRTYRNKVRRGSKWIFNANIDSRLCYCSGCHEHYYAESTLKIHIKRTGISVTEEPVAQKGI